MPAPTRMVTRSLAGRIGAEIDGVSLSGDLPEETVAAILDALHAHKVIFFRDQFHLTDAEQEAFTARLGPLKLHPTIGAHPGTRAMLNVASDGEHAANQWHTDITFLQAYPAASVLRAVHLPAKGGDTIWCNAATAYTDLSPAVRAFADQLWGLHSNVHDFSDARLKGRTPSTRFEAEHPVVRVHPVTGERSLLLGTFMARILDVSRDESFHIQQMLQQHVSRPENTVRWKWRLGDVAIWDNRATQHYGIGDFTERRELHRVTIEGDVPVSVDGRPSRVVSPVATAAAA